MNLELQIQFNEDPNNIEIVNCQAVEELEKIINQIVKNSNNIINVKITNMS